MKLISFNKLCNPLQSLLAVDAVMPTQRTNKDPISTEIILACFLGTLVADLTWIFVLPLGSV
jgi:hypothetical protein